MKHYFSKVKENIPIAKDFFKISFEWNGADTVPLPGQFCTIRVSENALPLLRRPFAFSEFDPQTNTASVIYQKRGCATEILAAKTHGELLDIIGPLGNEFPISQFPERVFIIAGGVGLGPMLFLAHSVKNTEKEYQFIFGCKNSLFIPENNLLQDVDPIICTDDGSEGFHGTTVDYLATLDVKDLSRSVIVACGPHPMLKCCHEFAQSNSLLCYVSMEQVMACGVGACMGCAVAMAKKGEYARVCKEGPVFNSKDIQWS